MARCVQNMARWSTSGRCAAVEGAGQSMRSSKEVSEEYREDKIEMVSVNSVYMNKSQLMLTAKLDMHTGNNKIAIPYKIDTGSDGNIMPRYIFKKWFQRVTEAELRKTIKNHIKLKMYNKTVIAQLGMCMVIINYKDNAKKCEFL